MTLSSAFHPPFRTYPCISTTRTSKMKRAHTRGNASRARRIVSSSGQRPSSRKTLFEPARAYVHRGRGSYAETSDPARVAALMARTERGE